MDAVHTLTLPIQTPRSFHRLEMSPLHSDPGDGPLHTGVETNRPPAAEQPTSPDPNQRASSSSSPGPLASLLPLTCDVEICCSKVHLLIHLLQRESNSLVLVLTDV